MSRLRLYLRARRLAKARQAADDRALIDFWAEMRRTQW